MVQVRAVPGRYSKPWMFQVRDVSGQGCSREMFHFVDDGRPLIARKVCTLFTLAIGHDHLDPLNNYSEVFDSLIDRSHRVSNAMGLSAE